MSDPESAVTVPGFIRGIAARSGDREAVVNGDRRITYRQLDDDSRRLARGLLARGVTKGSRIGLWLGNGPEWVVAWAAVCRVGAVAVPLSTFFKDRELARTIRHGDLQGVISHRAFLGDDSLARLEAAFPELRDRIAPDLALRDAPFLRWIVSIDDVDLPAWCRPLAWLAGGAEGTAFDEALLAEVESEVDPTDVAIMIYTSGSTSDHKGVPHTHRNIMEKTRYLRDMMKFDDSVRSYTPSPFFWVGGLTMSLFPVLSSGGTQLCTDRFDAEEVHRLFERERVTRANLYPHQLEAMLAHPAMETYDRSSLRDADARLLVGAARGRAHQPGELSIGVGMTETFGGYWWGRFDAPAEGVVLRPGERRTPPLDVLQPGVELKVVDEAGVPVADGGTGEICIRGVCVTPGLHKARRDEIFDADGWLHTGDLGEVDGPRVHFRGRMGEMIKTAGANVTPKEVVEALCAIDGVETAHVVALPDPVRGQVVAAAVVPEDGRTLDAEAIRAELKNELSTFKVPTYIVFFRADDIPWTQSFKIRKGMLAEMIRERVASAER